MDDIARRRSRLGRLVERHPEVAWRLVLVAFIVGAFSLAVLVENLWHAHRWAVYVLWGFVGAVIFGWISWVIARDVSKERGGSGGLTYRLALFFGGWAVFGGLFGAYVMGPWVLPFAAVGFVLCLFLLALSALVHRRG